jgi:hypothetical protein
MGTDDRNRPDRNAILEQTKEARECLKEEIRHIKYMEARRKKATRVFLMMLTVLTVAVHYLYFSSPGLVVVNKDGEIHGLSNKARATLQGNRFWRDQLHEVNRELQWDGNGILRNALDGRTSENTDRDANREMEKFYERYPQFRSSLAELNNEAVRGRVNQVKWMIFSGYLEEMRRERVQELENIFPIVRSKAGWPTERVRGHEIDRVRVRGDQIS